MTSSHEPVLLAQVRKLIEYDVVVKDIIISSFNNTSSFHSNFHDDNFPRVFDVTSTSYEDAKGVIWTHYCTEEEHQATLRQICLKLYGATTPTTDHCEKLDAAFTDLVSYHVALEPQQSIPDISGRAYDFLRRLPSTSLPLPDMPKLPSCYLQTDQSYNTWENMRVSSIIDSNVTRILLYGIIFSERSTHDTFKQYADLVADLLTKCCELEGLADPLTQSRWFVLRSFLWTSWQRAQMLFFNQLLLYQFDTGVTAVIVDETILSVPIIAPDSISVRTYSDQIASAARSEHMCTWAFNHLRADNIGIGADFRLFHERYSTNFGPINTRCNVANRRACDGKSFKNCDRFKTQVRDQSTHDESCRKSNCLRLKWDKTQYLSVVGARVVDLESSDRDNYLRYRSASDQTLAVSHVWSHGQGGRPEDGINQCLHMRYVRLARRLKCDSYFLDAACVPEDRQLRKEAIGHINRIFDNSKIVVLVDQDLLSINVVGKENDLEVRESLLVALLVCDWNFRAWTLLEGLRGRRNIHMLCKGSSLVSIAGLIHDVYTRGRIDLGILALAMPQLLKWTSDVSKYAHKYKSRTNRDPSVPMAGTMLGYRATTRSGDDVLIWSLITRRDADPTSDPETFWRSMQQSSDRSDRCIPSGFLVSSAPRLPVQGLGWAPSSTYTVGARIYPAFPSNDTDDAIFDRRGLFSAWWTCHLRSGQAHSYRSRLLSLFDSNPPAKGCAEIWSHYLRDYQYGALLQANSTGRHGSWLANDQIARYAGQVSGTLVVVVGSNKTRTTRFEIVAKHRQYKDRVVEAWNWLGVYEWPADVPLPTFKLEPIWIE